MSSLISLLIFHFMIFALVSFTFFKKSKEIAFIIEQYQFLVVLLITLTMFFFLIPKVNSGDIFAYQSGYSALSTNPFNLLEDQYYSSLNGVTSEYGFILIEVLIKIFIDNPLAPYLVLGTISIISILYLYKRNTTLYVLCFAMFSARVLFDFYFNTIRVGFASVFMLYATTIFDKNKNKSYFYVFIACLIHTSCIMLFFFLMIYSFIKKRFQYISFEALFGTFYKVLLWSIALLGLSYVFTVKLILHLTFLFPAKAQNYISEGSTLIAATNIFARLYVIFQFILCIYSVKSMKKIEDISFIYMCSLIQYLLFANMGLLAYRFQEPFQLVGFLVFAKASQNNSILKLLVFIYFIITIIMFYTRNGLFW